MGAVTRMDALADTSAFVAVEQGRSLESDLPRSLAVSYVTVGELIAGVLKAPTDPERLLRQQTLVGAQRLPLLRVDREVAQVSAEMRETAREAEKVFTGNDSWIAETAVAHGLPLVTQDRDYEGIFGLELIRV